MKKLLELKLKILAKLILNRYKPRVVGVTGSVGKTTTKEAIFTVLDTKYRVRTNKKNYNNEIGLPLTIIGVLSPGKNIFGWINVFFKAIKLILLKDKNYPKILVLEMGVDHPGDMDYFNDIVKCQIGVVTLVGSVHVEYFGTIEKLQEEKAKLIKNLNKDGCAILNYDRKKVMAMKSSSSAKVVSYGLNKGADLRARDIVYNWNEDKDTKPQERLKGLKFKIDFLRKTQIVYLPQVLGLPSVYSALAAAAVGINFNMGLSEIAQALKKYKPPLSRMNLIAGIKNTLIIDDSYNSEPKSSIAALREMKKIQWPSGRKIAALGDMLELGRYSEDGHRQVGQIVVMAGIDKLILVGERARDIGRGAEEAGMKKDDIFHFNNSQEAGRFIQERLRSGDLILVKGSQGARMEKIVKEIMADPFRASELVVRQDKGWINN